MSRPKEIAMMLGLILILAGCSTPSPERINLFDRSDYIFTQPGAVVAGVETKTPGIWLSKAAVTRLQENDCLAGKVPE